MSVHNWFAFGPRWPKFGPLVATTENASKCWFPTIIWKSIHAIQFKLGLYTYWVSVQNWFAFRPRWPNFGPLVATNDWKLWFPTIIWKSIHACQFTLGVYTYWVSVQNWFAFGPSWPNFGPLVATKLFKLVVSDCYRKNHSHNTFRTWCLHLLDECSQLICFWATLAKFWPSSAPKMDKIGWKWLFPTTSI